MIFEEKKYNNLKKQNKNNKTPPYMQVPCRWRGGLCALGIPYAMPAGTEDIVGPIRLCQAGEAVGEEPD